VRTWEYHNTLRAEGVDKPIVRGMAHDVTERRRAEVALQESEKRERARAQELQTILDTLPIPVLIAHDPECTNVTANRAGYEHFALPPCNLSLAVSDKKPLFHFRRGDAEISRDQLPLDLAIATGLPVRNAAVTLVLADGTERHHLDNAAPLHDSDGRVRGAVAAAIDVTEQVRGEEELLKSEEHFRMLVEQTPNGVFIADAAGNYTEANSAGAEMLGYKREEVLQLNMADIIAPEEMEHVPAELQALAEGGVIRGEWKFKRKDGSPLRTATCGQM
jgi:PAS domain S-box-containing protein